MNIPQENKIFLNIPSYDKIVYSHLLKSPALIEANGSPVVFPHRKPNAPKARMPYMFKTSSHEYTTQSTTCPLLQNIKPIKLDRMGRHEPIRCLTGIQKSISNRLSTLLKDQSRRLRLHCKTSSPLKRAMRPLRPMEAPITMGINHKPAPELLVPYWIDGLGSWWESALYSEAERAALAYCGALTEGNRLNITFDLAPSNDPGLS
jgi:hypothetical protein